MPIEVGDLKLYDVEELSGMLHIQDRTIRKLLREGILPARKLARKWYVSEDAIKEFFRIREKLREAQVRPIDISIDPPKPVDEDTAF